MVCENASREDSGVVLRNFSRPFSPRSLDCLEPSLTWASEGTCGAYLLCDSDGSEVGIFKPQDEESVPEHAVGMSEGANLYRERAAYLVSRCLGDLGVPTTIIKKVSHPKLGGKEKVGSLQRFVHSSCDMSDMGPSGIAADQVHKIGCLDILLFNVDRHEGNLLLCRDSSSAIHQLIPIDHGLCLPEIVSMTEGPNRELLSGIYFAWQTWPQARVSFTTSFRRLLRSLTQDNVEGLVRGLLADKDVGANISRSSWTTLKIGALILRVLSDFTLYEMSSIIPAKLPDILEEAWSASISCEDCEDIGFDETQAVVSFQGKAAVDKYRSWEQKFLSAFESLLRDFAASSQHQSTSCDANEESFEEFHHFDILEDDCEHHSELAAHFEAVDNIEAISEQEAKAESCEVGLESEFANLLIPPESESEADTSSTSISPDSDISTLSEAGFGVDYVECAAVADAVFSTPFMPTFMTTPAASLAVERPSRKPSRLQCRIGCEGRCNTGRCRSRSTGSHHQHGTRAGWRRASGRQAAGGRTTVDPVGGGGKTAK
mmetsp:Transcript_41614/g.111585  ORF Transcript_41614/g.111585 Transcript_41614/m.111585 type:complete len:545 (-) Transcript_41614:234-1868(-)